MSSRAGSNGRESAAAALARRGWTVRKILVLVAAILACSSPALPQGRLQPDWVGTWAMAPVQGDERAVAPAGTLRQIVHTSVAGSAVRIHLSNLFGDQPLRVENVHVALRSTGSAIVPGSDRQLRFNGRKSVVIPAGAAVTTDPIEFQLPALSDLAISMYLPKASGRITFHGSTHETSYAAAGNVSGEQDLIPTRTTESCYFLTNVDVRGKDLRGTIVAFGASITEGYKATDDTNQQWPSVLAHRLADAGIRAGVLNEGISGNRLLVDGAGESAEKRFTRDVLDQPGVRWVIFADDPINDLGSTRPAPSAGQLIEATKRLIAAAHQRHVQFFCSTLTPFEGANYWGPEEEVSRQQFNAFIVSSKSGCDAVIDQDRASHDPDHPSRFLPAYDSGDHLHPNDAGHRAIADAIDLRLFQSGEQSSRH
jgi:lysophospholipase L1-like esterase